MKATIESTEQLITINGIPARVWTGTTERGIPIQLAITRIAVHRDEDCAQFEAELQETHVPVPERPAFSLRMIL
jgi:hypothetical protein